MDQALYWLARGLLAIIRALPLEWVARLGRWGGAVAYALDARHRRVALRNLHQCFGRELSPSQVRAIARENFRRIGENFACAARTSGMTFDQLRPHVQLVGAERVQRRMAEEPGRGFVAAIGHFGNFELYARAGHFAPGYQCATTYRGLRQPALNNLLKTLREQSGCRFFERRFEASALKAFMNQPNVALGLLADQHAGDGGLRLPFLGMDCSTSAAPAVFALRYRCALFPAICYRVGLARWQIEAGEEIPTHQDGKPRPVSDLMRDVNRAFEAAVRRDPANWFWVHNRWKPRPPRPADAEPARAVGQPA